MPCRSGLVPVQVATAAVVPLLSLAEQEGPVARGTREAGTNQQPGDIVVYQLPRHRAWVPMYDAFMSNYCTSSYVVPDTLMVQAKTTKLPRFYDTETRTAAGKLMVEQHHRFSWR